MKKSLLIALFLCGGSLVAHADDGERERRGCNLPGGLINALGDTLAQAEGMTPSGIFPNKAMWVALVDRNGILCATVKNDDAWPGSRAIAIAKAETANDFSNKQLALSTANLYAATQPGGSLYGLNNSNPFNPFFNSITQDNSVNPARGNGVGFNPGGIITFGGGVALYSGGQVIGGLGVSGDASCTDHAVAYKMRTILKLDKLPKGVAPAADGSPNGTDDIIFPPTRDAIPTGFQHPYC